MLVYPRPMHRQLIGPFAAALSILLVATAAAGPPPTTAELPSGEEWLAHFVRDLLPYWSSPEALGDPVGMYPTFRYPDGAVIDADEPLRPEFREMHEHAAWIALRLGRTYTRMVSRQAYVLAVAFHLTGDGRYLAQSRAGVDRILGELRDGTGGFCSWIEDGACRPEAARRTSQDLAYAMLGPAMYAAVTGDPGVVAALVDARRRLFEAYRDDETGLLRWVLEPSDDPPDAHSPEQLELVAQLDQLNAYLLLAAPLVTGPDGLRWRADTVALTRTMVDRFYDRDHNVFWGRIDGDGHRRLGGHHHTDTGHTAKALWMTLLAARAGDDEDLARLARDGGLRLLEAVWLPEARAWSGGWKADGSLHGPALWWAYAEVDQLAASLSLASAEAAEQLPAAYRTFFERYVDHRHGGTWPFAVDPADDPPVLKAHLWKNGYHAAEHALVGLITSNARRGEPVTLHFAPAAGAEPPPLRPYLFEGDAEVVRRVPLAGLPGRERLEVRFTRIR